MLLIDHNESARADPWKVTDAPETYVDAMVKQIVGIEIPLRRLEGKWKMSQNRSARDRAGVNAGLAAATDDNSRAMAALLAQIGP